MSRIPVKKTCPEKTSMAIQLASNSTFFIVQEPGPMAFILKSDVEECEKVKVRLGHVQTCSCSHYMANRDVCVHIVKLNPIV